MSKSKRLMELMLAVNQKRKFTVKELAQEFGVSQRTILRDLQELSELGVPLYSEVGPHGGYRVLKERLLPPIAFTEEEAVAIFFAIHALRHYSALPFETESSSALSKFYSYMPPDIRERIDEMKNRVDFVTPARQDSSPYLSVLLDAAIRQKVLLIDYPSREKLTNREIQPIGLYTRNGFWYCPAHCFQHHDIRLFRCDRIQAVSDSSSRPLDLRHVHLDNHHTYTRTSKSMESGEIPLFADLTKAGVQTCESEPWSVALLHMHEDGTGWLEGRISRKDMLYFATFFICLGKNVTVRNSPELLHYIKQYLSELVAKYEL